MFNSAFLFAFAITFASFAVKAEVVPNTPSGLDTYNVGAKCAIAWDGDADASTKDKWKNMSIQLMTGANLDMVHLTTVAMDQDGSVGGTYEWDCPAVTPNSEIYFYQFRSPWIETAETQWTTRFTIASASGETTEPTDETDGIKWGTGTMEGGSPAPDFSGYSDAPGATSGGGNAGTPPAGTHSSSDSSSSTDSPSASPSGTDSPAPSNTDAPSDATPDSPAVSGTDSESSSSSSRMTRSSTSSSSSLTGTAGNAEASDAGDGDGALSMGASSAAFLFAVALAFVSL